MAAAPEGDLGTRLKAAGIMWRRYRLECWNGQVTFEVTASRYPTEELARPLPVFCYPTAQLVTWLSWIGVIRDAGRRTRAFSGDFRED